MAGPLKKRTDVGTIALHWLLVGAIAISTATGLKIEADGPASNTPDQIAQALPSDSVWVLHIMAGIVLVGLAAAYPLYIRRAGLSGRLTIDRIRLRALISGGAGRAAAVNVLLYWALFALLAWQLASGILLFRGDAPQMMHLHELATWAILAYVVAHVGCHFAAGGIAQLLRIVSPAAIPVRADKTMRRLPRTRVIVATASIGALAALGFVRADVMTRQTLVVGKIASPKNDFPLSDSSWQAARPVSVLTMQGANLDGAGNTAVEIRAVHDGTHAWFAFSWPDPTRSLRPAPLIKTAAGWRLLQDASQVDDGYGAGSDGSNEYAEDRLAIMISEQERPYGPGAFHPGRQPLPDKPPSSSGRGLHYTTDGSHVESWIWNAASDLGRCDDVVIGAPEPVGRDERVGAAPYRGGVRPLVPEIARRNYIVLDPEIGSVEPARLPRDIAALQARLGKFDVNPARTDPSDARWWLSEAEAVPFSREADEATPVGTIIPSRYVPVAPSSAAPACKGTWSAGRWTVIVERSLHAELPNQIDLRTGASLFVAVFDRTAARHTRHVRPVRLELAP